MEAAPPCPEEEASTDPRDAWEIKKTLQASDLGNLLILETNFVKNLIFSYLGNKTAQRVETKAGAQVHRMESPAKSYAFDEDWNQEFVKRRELKEGDEIRLGLYTPTPSGKAT
ncbi:B3 domain-containing protein [Pyrus ussuriensis x Pyrus communis]|uniref:B3 domain-containing protein n=1 Tax=Pyrus ussuriensis x Pyrus communis TaxID=2448454 RepID=A0A5N5HD48_9ROSA|nr:B3 domain-containing protein [Pyrus ussuriensis x Pyrus communis]KAB2634341.1 B3 domain-containing protein [Pyrus ussuriensis x Pyrus communis]